MSEIVQYLTIDVDHEEGIVMMTEETPAEAVAEVEARRAHRTSVWVLIVLGTLVLVLSTANIWVVRQLLDTDSWVETSSDLLDDDEVRHELSVRLVNALYENVDVGTAIDDRLPEQLQGLGGPLAGVLRDPLVDTADSLLASGQARTAWEAANRTVHAAVVAILEDDVGDNVSTSGGTVVIDLGAILRQVGEQIGLPDAALDAIPPDAGQFEVINSDNLEAAQTAVKAVKVLSFVTYLLVVILFGAAIYLARDWRRATVRNVGFAIAVGGFIVFVTLGLGRRAIAGQPDTPGGRAAADSILEVGTVLLRQMAVSEILIGLLVALGASLIGPARYAKWVRGYSAKGFRRAAVATWVGFAVVILAVIAWTPIIATSSWLTVLIVLILVVVGIEAIRRTSLAEEATLLESEAAIEVAHADAGTDES